MSRVRGLAIGLCLFTLVAAGCREPRPPGDSATTQQASANRSAEPEHPADGNEARTPQPAVQPEPIDWPLKEPVFIVEDDARRWLFVDEVTPGERGGYATGDFLPERNKLVIDIKNVEAFTVDTAKIRINWERPVIFSLNSKNSELVKRDTARMNFIRNSYGAWVVKESAKDE